MSMWYLVAINAVLSAALCGLYLVFARRMQVVDTPDHRSSHSLPTPHGAGVALIGAFALCTLLAITAGALPGMPWLPLLGAALVLAATGIADDLYDLDLRWRLAVYVLVCAATPLWLVVGVGGVAGSAAWLFACAGAVGLVVLLNFYNFMDGIDGIAASQAVLACAGAAVLAILSGEDQVYALVCALLAASHAGFLAWNWPPARLFMGDAGSVPTGYLLGALALVGQATGQVGVAPWLVLLGVFIVDAGWTLAWRMFTGQPFTQPHRQHAYQRLSRHWQSHRRVDIAVIAVNVLWLFPLAWVTHKNPSHALFLVILAYLPLVTFMAKIRRLH